MGLFHIGPWPELCSQGTSHSAEYPQAGIESHIPSDNLTMATIDNKNTFLGHACAESYPHYCVCAGFQVNIYFGWLLRMLPLITLMLASLN